MIIELTQQQAQVLVNLLDMAVKAGGLQVAGPATEISRLVLTAVQTERQFAQMPTMPPMETPIPPELPTKDEQEPIKESVNLDKETIPNMVSPANF